MQKEILEVIVEKLRHSHNATKELSIFKISLERHLNHLDGIEQEHDEAHAALMEKVLNKGSFMQLMAKLARNEISNEKMLDAVNSVLELLIRILVVKLKHKTYD